MELGQHRLRQLQTRMVRAGLRARRRIIQHVVSLCF